VIAYSVSQRTREIGIRMALGATASEVRRLVVAQGARLLIAGSVIGIAGGALIATGARSLLYGVSAADPSTYGLVVAIIVAVMTVATFVPARRATGVDPNDALRAD
jgi:putative ABC transport system permease protein